MRILLVTQDFPPVRGGIQTYCHRLALGLHQLGHTLQVVCPSHSLAKEFDNSMPFHVIRLGIHSSFLWIPWLAKARKITRQFSPDVLLYGQWQNGLWNILPGYGPLRHTPQATLVHGRELLDSAFLGATRSLARRVLSKLALTLPNSHPVGQLLAELGVSVRSTVVHPGVDPDRFASADPQVVRGHLHWNEAQIVGVVTRLVPRKNLGALLRAGAALRAKNPKLRILIGGEGPDRLPLQTLAATLGILDICHFAGSVPQGELAHYFAALDLLVMPSISAPNDIEGFGIVYLEAGSLGIPTLAYASGGVVDAVCNGESGILVEQGDEMALQNALETLLRDGTLRQRLGIGAKKRAQELTWAANAKKISEALTLLGLAAKLPS